DIVGFSALSIFLASLQLMLDRGQQLDWFSSSEIRIEAASAAFFAYVTLVHIFTAKHPFARPTIFLDRNFLTGSILAAVFGVLIFAVLPLISTMLQQLMGYPVMLSGLVLAPRSIGTAAAMIVIGRLINRVDPRYPLLVGLSLSSVGFYELSHLSLQT